MDANEIEIAKYEAAANNEKYEAEMVWQTFSAFLLAQTIFLAFLLQSSFAKENMIKFDLGTNVAAIFGLLICVPWMISFYRSMAFLNLRSEQARLAEPESWNLLSVSVEERHYKIAKWIPNKVAKKLTTRCSVVLLIWFFVGIYLIIFFFSGPWITS